MLVLGAAGGVGLAAVEIGKALGARVIAAASTREKLAVCAAHGADGLICYGRGADSDAVAAQELKKQLKALCPKGVDVCYDPVGGPFSEAAIRSMARGGRHLIVGFAAGVIPKVCQLAHPVPSCYWSRLSSFCSHSQLTVFIICLPACIMWRCVRWR